MEHVISRLAAHHGAPMNKSTGRRSLRARANAAALHVSHSTVATTHNYHKL